jgi:nucleoid-associated protein YgaU
MSASSLMVVGCAVATVSFGAACGGAGAATPTPTVVPSAAVSPVTAPSPQRPPLASPAASPAPAVAAASPTAASASADTSAGDTYEVQSGDTLLTIAEQSYSDATQWRRIYDANKDVIGSDPDKLKIGMKLKIPPKQ